MVKTKTKQIVAKDKLIILPSEIRTKSLRSTTPVAVSAVGGGEAVREREGADRAEVRRQTAN
jgi:hypothetical protein